VTTPPPREAGVSPTLLRVYRRTRYTAAGITLRIGRRSAGIDALLGRLAARDAVLVTAWNPFSRPMPDGWNRRMQARLRERLRGWRTLSAEGGLGCWQEDHLLVIAPLPPVRVLGRLFRQNALVAIRRRAPARLVLLAGRRHG
jgi:hypothetical protein